MTETRLTEAEANLLRTAAAGAYVVVADLIDPAHPATTLWGKGLLRPHASTGDYSAYSITPAGRALLSKGEW